MWWVNPNPLVYALVHAQPVLMHVFHDYFVTVLKQICSGHRRTGRHFTGGGNLP